MAHNLTPAKELLIRQWLKDKINDVDPNIPVLITPFYFTSRQDFIGQLYPTTVITMTAEEIRLFEPHFVVISYLRFQDSKKQGCDDNPVVDVLYNIQIFKYFKDVRGVSPGPYTNSHDELLEFYLNLRNEFLDNRDHPTLGGVSCYPLTQPTNMQRRGFSEYLANDEGSILNTEVKVEVI